MNANGSLTTVARGSCQRTIVGGTSLAVITGTELLGVVGNIAALCILRGQARNRRHALMLRCLAANDLVALLGMLVQLYLRQFLPCYLYSEFWFCVVRVLWRIFGLGSGCVAIVMAIERWLALTHPFFYQRNVTYHLIQRSIFALWAVVLVLVCLPFFRFGVYFDSKKKACIRFKMAKKPLDIAYAYLFFSFGAILCVCIVVCNLAVIRALCRLGCRGRRRRLGRRISRHSSRHGSHSTSDITYDAATTEEVSFARLMAVLSISFVVCWVPQLMSIPLAQYIDPTKDRRSLNFLMTADCLLALHFTLDPYVYVLFRHSRRGTWLCTVLKNVFRKCSRGGGDSKSNTGSLALTEPEPKESIASARISSNLPPPTAV